MPARLMPATAGLAAVALVAVGALCAAALLPERTPALVAAPQRAGTVAVSTETYDGAHSVSATPQLGQTLTLRSPDAGTLTRTVCSPGAAVMSGTSPMTVDDRPTLALATSIPLWRDLSTGVSGQDVSAVQTELARLGSSVQVTGKYDAATRSAVRDLRRKIGVAKPDGNLAVGSVLWLPAAKVVIASCSAQVGEVVTPGQEVAEVAGALKSLTLLNPPGEGWVARYGDKSAAVDGSGKVTDAAFRAAVEAGPELKAVLAADGGGSISLDVALAEPRQVLVVPPGAVIVAGAGTGCLVAQGRSVPVDIVSSSLGQTLVQVTKGAAPTRVERRPDASVRCS